MVLEVVKPGWVDGEDFPIFSVDIHPNGLKFATGGQGSDCGRIVIWNMEPIRNEKAQKDPKIPKQLCQMENHLACVNSVRWSGDGKYLASAGDDKLVMLWTKSAYGGGTVFGGGGKVNHENYKCSSTLRQHAGDVLDLSWSPDDRYLASCSVDNTVIVWDVSGDHPTSVSVLRGHTSHVKGVTWDPVGKYLASQGADKTLRIWRTSDWKEEQNIKEPFKECGGTTHVLRLNWSPDGQYIVSAHAMNSGGPTAQIIERDGFKYERDYVGHRKAVTCVRFNSNIFHKSSASGTDSNYVCVAIGSRDRSISVWLTCLRRPLLVLNDLFDSSVMDLAWSKERVIP
jgi:protein HIRA/HIR1